MRQQFETLERKLCFSTLPVQDFDYVGGLHEATALLAPLFNQATNPSKVTIAFSASIVKHQDLSIQIWGDKGLFSETYQTTAAFNAPGMTSLQSFQDTDFYVYTPTPDAFGPGFPGVNVSTTTDKTVDYGGVHTVVLTGAALADWTGTGPVPVAITTNGGVNEVLQGGGNYQINQSVETDQLRIHVTVTIEVPDAVAPRVKLLHGKAARDSLAYLLN